MTNLYKLTTIREKNGRFARKLMYNGREVEYKEMELDSVENPDVEQSEIVLIGDIFQKHMRIMTDNPRIPIKNLDTNIFIE